jgi:DNA fragmentation factor, 40 kD, beta subunit
MERRAQDRIRGYFYKTKDEITKSELYRSDKQYKIICDEVIEQFRQLLIGVDHFSTLFNRKCKNKLKPIDKSGDELDSTPRKRLKINATEFVKNNDLFDSICVSLCDDHGMFRCCGLWYDEKCNYQDHFINPYASRENLILFQTWNLDHQIEISRTVLPSLLNSAQSLATVLAGPKGSKIVCDVHKVGCKKMSVLNYFLELFTVKNLKLCHIVCHDKTVHDLKKSQGRLICEKCDEYKFIEKFQSTVSA